MIILTNEACGCVCTRERESIACRALACKIKKRNFANELLSMRRVGCQWLDGICECRKVCSRRSKRESGDWRHHSSSRTSTKVSLPPSLSLFVGMSKAYGQICWRNFKMTLSRLTIKNEQTKSGLTTTRTTTKGKKGKITEYL